MKLKTLPWEDTVKISKDYAITAIQTATSLPRKQGQPLRFVYMSGHFAPRERTEQPKVLGDHGLMEYGYLRVSFPPLAGPSKYRESAPASGLMRRHRWLTAALTAPNPGRGRVPHPSVRRRVQGSGPVVRHQVRLHQRPGKVMPNVPGLPLVELRDIAAAMLDQVAIGFEKDTLSNDDLVRIGKKALGE